MICQRRGRNFGFAGLQPGIGAYARRAGRRPVRQAKAPQVRLAATNRLALAVVGLQDLNRPCH